MTITDNGVEQVNVSYDPRVLAAQAGGCVGHAGEGEETWRCVRVCVSVCSVREGECRVPVVVLAVG